MDVGRDQEQEYIDASSKLGQLIIKVNRIEKKPTLDDSLSQILNAFLDTLSKSSDYLENGIFQLNFAEAALLLQSSAFVYSKKVDLLWDNINECQKRMIAFKSNENNEELKRLEEREQKYKRKRKAVEAASNKDKTPIVIDNFHIDWNDVSEFQHLHCEKDSSLFSAWYKKMIVNWDLQPTRKNTILAEKFSHFRGLENSICDKDQDDDFVVHTSKMESVMALDNLILQQKPIYQEFSFSLFSELYLIPKFLGKNGYGYEDLSKHKEELKEFFEGYRHEYCSNDNFKSSSSELTQTAQKLRRESICSMEVSKCRLDCQVNLQRLPLDKLGRVSKMSYCTAPIEDFNQEQFIEGENIAKIANSDCGLVATALPESIDLEEIENSAGLVPRTDLIDVSTQVTEHMDYCLIQPETECLINQEVLRTVENGNTAVQCETDEDNVPLIDLNPHMTRKKRIVIERDESDIQEQIPEKKRRLSKAALKKLATGITADLKKFNTFFAANYQPEEGEGQVDTPEFEFDPTDSSSVIDPEEQTPLTQKSNHTMLTQDSGYVTRNDESDIFETSSEMPCPTTKLDSSPNPNPIPETPCLPSTEPADGVNINEENVPNGNEKPLYQKVYEWKQHMSEKFKSMKSSDFDIREYGMAIMENLEEDRPKKFGDIVQGKTSAEVTRFFISALQLANTYNVDIQGAQDGSLSNETFALKLITRDHCYDRLKDYVAPSEETYQERLTFAHNSRKKHFDPGASTSGYTNYKRRKI